MKIKATTEIMQVTPEMAENWLRNKLAEQRSIRTAHVEKLASDMRAGRFALGPDAILLVNGKLANGQHRLTAVMQQDKPQPFIVMQSNDSGLYKVIDAGLRRTVADGLVGNQWAQRIPAIARWVQTYQLGALNPKARSSQEASSRINSTQSAQIDYCMANLEILQEASSFVEPLYKKTHILPVSMGGAIYVIGATAGKLEKAKAFLKCLYIEGGLSAAGDLRNRLINNRGSKAKLAQGYVFGLTIKAFDAFQKESRIGTLKWAKGEKFPTVSL